MAVVSYIAWIYPGSFISTEGLELTSSPQTPPTVWPERAYGYQIKDRVEATIDGEKLLGRLTPRGPRYFIGDEHDLARVERELPRKDVLISNMKFNGWNRCLRCRQGFIPLEPDDVVVGPDAALAASPLNEGRDE